MPKPTLVPNGTQDNWRQLLDASTTELLGFFQDKEPPPDAHIRARVAATVLSACTRHEATESAKEQTGLIIARQMANTRDEFARYVVASVPRLKTLVKPPKTPALPASAP